MSKSSETGLVPRRGSPLRRLAGNWWVKVLGQKTIGLLPGRLGREANLAVARVFQGRIAERPTAAEYRVLRSVRNLEIVREHTGVVLGGGHVLEIGTGWRGCDPALFFLFGADRVTTVDHERWLKLDSFIHSIDLIERLWPRIEAEARHHTPDAAARLALLTTVRDRAESLDEALDRLAINYRIAPSADPRSVGVAPGTVDLFYTESVLQRIPRQRIGYHVAHVCEALLKNGGAVFHRTDQRDIHTLEHVGNDTWALGYLRFSDWVFDTFLNGRFISQNRLRESDFLDLLQSCGIAIRYVESRRENSDLERLPSIRLAGRFRDKTPEDVVTRCSLIVGQKCPADGRPTVRKVVVGTLEEVER